MNMGAWMTLVGLFLLCLLYNPIENQLVSDVVHYLDQRLLGRSHAAYNSPSIGSLSHTTGVSHRLSLPLSASNNRPTRILGDASHHFRPFVPREHDRPSPFQNTPQHYAEPGEINPQYSIYDTQPRVDNPRTFSRKAPAQRSGARLEPSSPYVISHSNLFQDSTPRVGELQRGTQLFAPTAHSCKIFF